MARSLHPAYLDLNVLMTKFEIGLYTPACSSVRRTHQDACGVTQGTHAEVAIPRCKCARVWQPGELEPADTLMDLSAGGTLRKHLMLPKCPSPREPGCSGELPTLLSLLLHKLDLQKQGQMRAALQRRW